ncbi:MAG TPA: response regulator transcription factor [Mycobacteriales bacterium]|nr:response regulator transcription factor [Mycobacteriales bacterium]
MAKCAGTPPGRDWTGQLLVVDDDRTIGSLLHINLATLGHEVSWVRSGGAALRSAAAVEYDLVLLELGLPDLDGLEVCRRLRRRLPGCVLVALTARTEEADVVAGLAAGADDYLTKPFRWGELTARVRAHLRRGPGHAAGGAVVLGDLVLDIAARRCSVGGVEVPLRARELDLLARLAAEPGTAVSRVVLMAEVWDENWCGSTKTLDVHVATLRRRLAGTAAVAGVDAPSITTLRGYGYRLDAH